MSTSPAADGRGALRLQRRDAIVAAARTLAGTGGAAGFTVDQVAQLAGVSRRTVFNHFATVDHLLVAVCEQILAEATADILAHVDRDTSALPEGAAGGCAALDAMGEAARQVDLASAIVTIHRMLGCPEPGDDRAQAISRTAFDHVGGLLRERLRERAPGLDAVDLELGLSLMFAGITTIAELWLAAHPELEHELTPSARVDWDRLLDRLVHRLRTGNAG
ncbi:TetR/AcrR family transcriptional regulator [Nocardioides KLBMP 9356]|uniref:TetR/AcrR family transcriptional regulator n=1 Tax=Nocardioides potassii TaxID=2911371 RepID=A0ABS9HDB1_9ACTN|nr:TetR/AcrR family transcriptional regulator [Nocardioides potassii]MCF6378301.1 TetR/AcrR family transcriptional regulator [Nocardioides potassii]